MALESFRQVKLQMNKADGSILKTIYAKEDDYNGRELVIQITDDGIVRDLTGADVNLGWKNLNVGNQGLEPFRVIDSTQGIYKVVYPTEMLNKGEILCTIQLIYDGSMIHSRNFKIIIESNPVDSDAVESDNNFSVLQDALIRISTLEEGYAPRLNAVEGSVDSLTDYIGNLTTLTTVEKSNIVGALNEIDTNHKSHLADYATLIEEGTFTPFISDAIGNRLQQPGTQKGFYYKIGSTVFFHVVVSVLTVGTSISGAIRIEGLPFISKNETDRYASVNVGYADFVNIGTGNTLNAFIRPEASRIEIGFAKNNGEPQGSLLATMIKSSTQIMLSGQYQI